MLKAPQYFEFQARHGAVQRVAPRGRLLDNRYAAVSARIQHLQIGRTLRERRHVAPGALFLDTRHAPVSVRAQHPGGLFFRPRAPRSDSLHKAKGNGNGCEQVFQDCLLSGSAC